MTVKSEYYNAGNEVTIERYQGRYLVYDTAGSDHYNKFDTWADASLGAIALEANDFEGDPGVEPPDCDWTMGDSQNWLETE